MFSFDLEVIFTLSEVEIITGDHLDHFKYFIARTARSAEILFNNQLTLHKVGPGLEPPHDLTLLGAIHPSVLTVPHVGWTGFICRRVNVLVHSCFRHIRLLQRLFLDQRM